MRVIPFSTATPKKLKEKLLPLSTSYTETGNVGRPAKDAQDKSAKTVANEESLDRGGSN